MLTTVSPVMQICWLWEKIPCASPDEKSFQQFLDSVQYTSTGILRYERIFGPGFVSTGGISAWIFPLKAQQNPLLPLPKSWVSWLTLLSFWAWAKQILFFLVLKWRLWVLAETTEEFVERLDLKAGSQVLDVGCGIGGGDFYMAEKYNVEVVGIDLSVNMISIALERAIGLKCACQFEVADCTKRVFPKESFDVVYSRDTILHIQVHIFPLRFNSYCSFFTWTEIFSPYPLFP